MEKYGMVEYEFTAEHNVIFDKLSSTLRRFAFVFGFWMLTLIIWGVVLYVDGSFPIPQVLAVVGTGLLGLIISYLFLQPLDNFRRITTSKGKDIPELMEALEDLDIAYNFLRLIIAICLLVRVIIFANDMGWV